MGVNSSLLHDILSETGASMKICRKMAHITEPIAAVLESHRGPLNPSSKQYVPSVRIVYSTCGITRAVTYRNGASAIQLLDPRISPLSFYYYLLVTFSDIIYCIIPRLFSVWI